MNLILLDCAESRVFPAATSEAEHLLRVLRFSCGDTFWCGVKNGQRGLATILNVSSAGDVEFSVAWEKAPCPALPPIHLLVGLSRPQTMKKIFAIAGELGCARVDIFQSEKGDPAYSESSIWKSEDKTISKILEKSLEQTCMLASPDFSLFESLDDFLNTQKKGTYEPVAEVCVALDVYEREISFSKIEFSSRRPVLLAIGSERGWSEGEYQKLRNAGFSFAHLGNRVLRVETAVAAALAVTLSKMDFWSPNKPLETTV